MLLKKNLLNLIYHSRKKLDYESLLVSNVFYALHKNNRNFFFIGLNILLISKFIILSKSYYYFIKIKIPSNVIFNSILIIFLNISKKIINPSILNNKLKFNFVSKKKKFYSVIRSPFVYKISQEQFFFNHFIGIIIVQTNNSNNFFNRYLEFFLKNFFKNWLSSKTILKRLIKIL
jgi:hypothetical protein